MNLTTNKHAVLALSSKCIINNRFLRCWSTKSFEHLHQQITIQRLLIISNNHNKTCVCESVALTQSPLCTKRELTTSDQSEKTINLLAQKRWHYALEIKNSQKEYNALMMNIWQREMECKSTRTGTGVFESWGMGLRSCVEHCESGWNMGGYRMRAECISVKQTTYTQWICVLVLRRIVWMLLGEPCKSICKWLVYLCQSVSVWVRVCMRKDSLWMRHKQTFSWSFGAGSRRHIHYTQRRPNTD